MTGVMTAVADFTIGEFGADDFNDKLLKNINGLKLSDVLGEEAFKNSKVLNSIKDSKIEDLDESINSMYVGEMLDYHRERKTVTIGETEYELYQDYNGNKYYNATALEEDGKTYTGYWSNEDGSENTAISLAQDASCQRYTYTSGGKTYYLYDANDWYEKYEDEDNKEKAEGVTSIMANVKIGELDDPDFTARINAEVENHKLGEIIEIDKDDMIILQRLKHVKIKEMSKFMNRMYIGDLMGLHIADGDIYLFTDNAEPKSTTFCYNEATYEWTWTGTGTVPTIEEDSNGYYYQSDADKVYLEPIFDFTDEPDTTQGETKTDDITRLIAGYSISEVTSRSFGTDLIEDIKTKVKVSTFFDRTKCTVFKLFDEEEFNALTIGGMTDAIKDKLENATLGNAVTLGILSESTFADTKGTTACKMYNDTQSDETKKVETWKDIPANDFLTTVINSALTTYATTTHTTP